MRGLPLIMFGNNLYMGISFFSLLFLRVIPLLLVCPCFAKNNIVLQIVRIICQIDELFAKVQFV